MDTEKLDAKQMAALLDTASSTRNPVVLRIVRSGSRKTVAIPIKKVEHKKVEEKFPLRRNGSITLEAETGFVTTPTLSHAQTPLAVDSQRQQEGRLETPRSCDSAGGSTSGDGDRRWSVIHEGFSESPTSPRQGAFARTGCHHGHTADTCKHTHVRDIPIVDVSSCYANVTFTWTIRPQNAAGDALAQKSLSRTSSGLHSDFASPQIQNGGSGKPGNAPIPAICRCDSMSSCRSRRNPGTAGALPALCHPTCPFLALTLPRGYA